MTSEKKKVEKPEDKGNAGKNEDTSKKKGLERWGKFVPLTAALMSATISLGCGDATITDPPDIPSQDAADGTDEKQDAGVDGEVGVDGDVVVDGGVDGDIDVDGTVDADEDLDAGVDGDVDVDGDVVVDGGVDGDIDVDGTVDAGVDGDVDQDTDVILPCVGIYDEIVDRVDFSRGEDVLVGGYYIRYVSATVRNVSVDVRCADSNAAVAIDQSLRIGDETVIEAPEDGKKIRITVHSQNAWGILCTVVVEDL